MPLEPGPCPARIALQIWNASAGIDWAALDVLTEIYGVTDIEILIAELLAIRAFQESANG